MTQEELNTLKEEVENVSKKLSELTDEKLNQVSGGVQAGEILCTSKNMGTSACSSNCKGKLSQCVGCSRNHD